MIRTGYMKSAHPQILRPAKNKIIINLEKAKNNTDIIKIIGNILAGSDSPKTHGRSLDALIDVVGDWAYEIMKEKPEKFEVSIINLRTNGIDHVFLAELVSSLNSAIMRGANIYKKENKISDVDNLSRLISIDILIL